MFTTPRMLGLLYKYAGEVWCGPVVWTCASINTYRSSMSNTILAPISLTVRNIADFRRDVMARHNMGTSIDIDLDPLEEVDLSLLQLLIALRAAAAEAGRAVRLRSPAPAPVAALLERAGFLAAATPQDLDFWFHGETAQ